MNIMNWLQEAVFCSGQSKSMAISSSVTMLEKLPRIEFASFVLFWVTSGKSCSQLLNKFTIHDDYTWF